MRCTCDQLAKLSLRAPLGVAQQILIMMLDDDPEYGITAPVLAMRLQCDQINVVRARLSEMLRMGVLMRKNKGGYMFNTSTECENNLICNQYMLLKIRRDADGLNGGVVRFYDPNTFIQMVFEMFPDSATFNNAWDRFDARKHMKKSAKWFKTYGKNYKSLNGEYLHLENMEDLLTYIKEEINVMFTNNAINSMPIAESEIDIQAAIQRQNEELYNADTY